MKIAHVIRALEVGGAERVTAELASAFAESGDDVTIFAGWPAALESPAHRRLDPAVHVEYIDDRERSRVVTYLRGACWVWTNRVRLEAFDVLHCHLTYGAVIGTFVKLVRGLRQSGRPRLVETYHSVGAPIPRWTRWLHSLMAAQSDVLVLMAVDSYWIRFAQTHPAVPVKTVLNGTPTPNLGSLDHVAPARYRRELGIPPEAAFVVGSIGMLRPDRQPRVFVPVIAAMVRELGDEVHWIFAGDGPERPELERLVAAAGISKNVHFAGVVSDVRYPLSVMALHFTITVGVVGGMAAIESALAGVPVIGFQLSVDYQTEGGDWIWSSSDSTTLADTAVRLLRDREERLALARLQQKYAMAHHSVEQMTSAYREIYQGA